MPLVGSSMGEQRFSLRRNQDGHGDSLALHCRLLYNLASRVATNVRVGRAVCPCTSCSPPVLTMLTEELKREIGQVSFRKSEHKLHS